jgi:tetraacyldisaccharide 4'-kinase
MALVKHFKQQGKKVGVVSRGYGGTHTQGSLLVDQKIITQLTRV